MPRPSSSVMARPMTPTMPACLPKLIAIQDQTRRMGCPLPLSGPASLSLGRSQNEVGSLGTLYVQVGERECPVGGRSDGASARRRRAADRVTTGGRGGGPGGQPPRDGRRDRRTGGRAAPGGAPLDGVPDAGAPGGGGRHHPRPPGPRALDVPPGDPAPPPRGLQRVRGGGRGALRRPRLAGEPTAGRARLRARPPALRPLRPLPRLPLAAPGLTSVLLPL